MVHNMRLNNSPFELIKNGSKTIELRVNDEKRRTFKVNDTIIFKNRLTTEILKVKITNLFVYPNFEELYKHFDKISMGYKENEVANASDMDEYYPQEEQLKYGVVGIEMELLNKNTKEIINTNNINNLEEINCIVKRAKLLIENDKNEILVCHSHHNYFLLGGHVEEDETDEACLNRELNEEAGVNIDFEDLNPFMTIKYFDSDYPEVGINTFSLINYYSIKYNLIPNLNNLNLTDDEKEGNFTIEFIDKKIIIDYLTNALKEATRPNVVKDTIEVIKEYLNN